MRLKTFTAPTIQEAMALVREELGPDAIILTTHYARGKVEVRAATDAPSAFSKAEIKPRPSLWDLKPRALAKRALERVGEALTWHGAPEEFARAMGAAATHLGLQDPHAALAAAFESRLNFAPVPPAPPRTIMFVGGPGAGKTTVAGKIAARALAATGGVELITAGLDDGADVAVRQLSRMSTLPDRLVEIARTPSDLSRVLKRRDVRKPCIVDGSATNPFDKEAMTHLHEMIVELDVDPVLVLAADGHPLDQSEAARNFAEIGVRRAVLTRLDTVRRRGGAIAAIAAADMSFAQIGGSPLPDQGLAPATPARLARLVIESLAEQQLVKGVA